MVALDVTQGERHERYLLAAPEAVTDGDLLDFLLTAWSHSRYERANQLRVEILRRLALGKESRE